MDARRISAIAIMIAALLVASCATTNPVISEGKQLIAQGRVDEGLVKLEQEARARPRDPEAHNAYVTQREIVVGGVIADAEAARNRGDSEAAEKLYRRALQLDPGNIYATNGVDAVERDRRHAGIVIEAEQSFKRSDYAAAERAVRQVLAENGSHRAARTLMRAIAEKQASAETVQPTLKAALAKPITLEFRDANLRSVFEVISRTAGINFVFDRDVRPDMRTTIFVRNTSLDDVIKLLLITNGLERKVINDNSVLIFPNTPAKQKDYQELVVRSFYLANADVKQTAAMIKALVKTRDLFVDEKLNLLVMKDTPEAVRLAEKLVSTQDLGEPEVMLEVEVLEVASSRVRELGLRYPERVNFGVLGTSAGNATTGIASVPPALVELKPREFQYFVANPAVVLNIRQLDGMANILANPRIRVKNRDKAKIHIGEKVPVITTTSTANVGVSSSVNYLEVGLKLDVEPNVYLEDEVAIKVQLEVSNILEQLNVSGTISYRLGTRNTATTLRLKDGETQVLAGLISDEDRRSANKLPYLGDFPALGRLFRSDNDNRTKTEIVLLITPRVVRNLARPATVAAQFSSGTDAAPGAEPLRLATTGPGSLALSAGGGAAEFPAPSRRAMPSIPQPAAEQPAELLFDASPEAEIGREWTMNVGLAPGDEGRGARIEVLYDPKALNVVGGAPGQDSGRTVIEIAAPPAAGAMVPPVTVRFRVVAQSPTTTQVNFVAAEDGAPVSGPSSHSVRIVAPGGVAK